MVMLVWMEWYFQGVVQVPGVPVAWLRINLRRRDKRRVLNLLLRFEMPPNVLLVLSFRASGFPPNKLDQR